MSHLFFSLLLLSKTVDPASCKKALAAPQAVSSKPKSHTQEPEDMVLILAKSIEELAGIETFQDEARILNDLLFDTKNAMADIREMGIHYPSLCARLKPAAMKLKEIFIRRAEAAARSDRREESYGRDEIETSFEVFTSGVLNPRD